MRKELLLLLLAGCMLVGCHSDLQLNDIDTSAQLNMGLALKIATVTATLGDFTDQSEDLFIYRDSTAGDIPKMVVAWRHAYPDEKDYHTINFQDYLPDASKEMRVYNKLQTKGYLDNGKITPDGSQIVLDFGMDFPFSGINQYGSTNRNRIDSAYFDYAQFISSVGRYNLPLEWNWIDSVVLDLGDQIECPNKIQTVYRRGDAAGYGSDLYTNLSNFKLMLMKNRNLMPELSNVYPSCKMMVYFMFTIPQSAGQITVPQDAAFNFNLKLADTRWTAIWGYFTPSKDMQSDEFVDMDDWLHGYPFAKRAKLPFTDPKIEVEVSTHIAGRMVIEGSNLYVIDANDQRIDATFDASGKTTREEHMDNYLNPADLSNIGDSAMISILFDNTVNRGKIDRMFKTMPKFLNYRFDVSFDTDKTPQIRVTPNTNVRINAICTLPLMFERDMFIDYQDTITDVDLKDVDVDSLANQVDFVDSLHVGDVNMYLTARNYIPLTMKGTVRFVDGDGHPVMDPEDPSKEFYPFQEDTIRFIPPRFINVGGVVMPDPNSPGKTLISARMNQKQIEALKQIKSIEYNVTADNDALQYAYDMGLKKIRLEKDSRLYIDVGITTQLEAFMNFENKK